MMRLDKYLSHAGYGTRKEVKVLLKEKRVMVNGVLEIKDKRQIDEAVDEVLLDQEIVRLVKTAYIMLHKPSGVISATQDHQHTTVMDCIDEFIAQDMFPVGRLDIDTEGLLLICNDGALAHRMLSPKHHVDKMYEVEIAHPLHKNDIVKLETGIVLSDFTTLPAKVQVIEPTRIYLTIKEGKFHQIKRMMHALDNEVIFLKRLRFGPLLLDETLQPGEWRYVSEEEIKQLQNI